MEFSDDGSPVPCYHVMRPRRDERTYVLNFQCNAQGIDSSVIHIITFAPGVVVTVMVRGAPRTIGSVIDVISMSRVGGPLGAGEGISGAA